MSEPDQHGDGEHKLPIANLSRSGVAKRLNDGLATIRREEGVDPRIYASVASDIRYDVQSTMYCADIVAQQTADLLRPAILSGHFPGRFPRTRALLRHPLTSAAIMITAGVIYMDSRTFEKPSVRQEYQRVVGQAILDAKPEILTSIGSKEITVTISGKRLNGADATLHLEHKLSEEDFQRLRQDLKK